MNRIKKLEKLTNEASYCCEKLKILLSKAIEADNVMETQCFNSISLDILHKMTHKNQKISKMFKF